MCTPYARDAEIVGMHGPNFPLCIEDLNSRYAARLLKNESAVGLLDNIPECVDIREIFTSDEYCWDCAVIEIGEDTIYVLFPDAISSVNKNGYTGSPLDLERSVAFYTNNGVPLIILDKLCEEIIKILK